MSRFIFRIGKITLILTSMFLLLVVLAISVLLYTSSGLKFVSWGVEKFIPSLQLGDAEGTLGRSFILHDVLYRDSPLSVNVKLKKVSVSLDTKCFLQPAVCIDHFAIDGAEVVLPRQQSDLPDQKALPEPVSRTDFSSPFPVKISQVILNHIHLTTPQAEVTWHQFRAGFSLQHDQLRFSQVFWHQVDVKLPDSSGPPKASATPAKSTGIAGPAEDISLPEIWIPLHIDMPVFHLSDLTLHQNQTPVYHLDQFDLAVSAGHHDVRIEKLALKSPEADLRLKGQVELYQHYPLNLNINSTVKDPRLKEQSVVLNATGSLQQLKAEVTLNGLFDGRIEAQISPLAASEKFPFHFRIKQFSGQWPAGDSPDYQFSIRNLEAQGNTKDYQVQAEGQVNGRDLPDTRFDFRGQGNQTQFDLSELALRLLNGRVSGHSFIEWQQGISIRSDIELAGIEPQVQWPDYPGKIDGHLKLNASLAESGWAVDVSEMNMTGQLRQYPLHVMGKLQASDDKDRAGIKLDISSLQIAHGPNNLNVQGKINQKMDLDVAVQFPDLSKSVASLFGRINGKVHLVGDVTAPDIKMNLTGHHVRWQKLFQAENLRLKGNLTSEPEIGGKISLEMLKGRYQDFPVSSATLNIRGTDKKHRAQLRINSPEGAGNLVVSGEATALWNQWRGTLEKADFSFKKHHLVLQPATRIEVNTVLPQVKIAAHCWRSQQARLCLKNNVILSPESGQLQLALHQLDLLQLAAFLPADLRLKGVIHGNALVQWKQGTPPEVTAEIKAEPGELKQLLPEPVEVHWQSANLSIGLKKNRLLLNGNLHLSQNGQLSLNLNIPDVKEPSRKMQGSFAINQLSLGFLKGLLGEYSDFNTVVNSRVDFKGEMLHPQLNGELLLSDMQVKGQMTPVDIRQGTIRVRLLGYKADWHGDVETPEGQLNLSGQGDWKSLAHWQVESRLRADAVRVSVLPMVSLKAEPDIRLKLTPELAVVSGKVVLPEGKIEIDQLPAGAVKVSDDQVIISGTTEQPRKGLPFRVETNINIELGEKVSLAAFGLKGRLQGKLNVVQRDQAPFVTGEVNILDGSYRSFGQNLIISQGKVIMNGPVDQPYVAITAIRNPEQIEDDVTAGIQVSGSADNPSVTIFSNPVMPQANALSYLLRGKNLTAESGGNTVTSSLIGLTLAQSGKLVGEIGQVFGVQDLELDTQGSGDETQVTVSGYVLPDLQVKYGVGVFNSVGEFTVRYRLMKNLYLEAISGLNSTVDLLYQFEFD